MSETQTQETQAAASAPAAPVKTAALTATIDGKSLKVLKYPFPVKAAKFPIKVNGVQVDAASTAGRGRSYTYMLVNNTSFYVEGVLAPDTEVAINFPDGYKFDDAVAARVSTYKPKKAKKEGAEQPATETATATTSADPATAAAGAATAAANAEQAPPAEAAATAVRRRK